MDDQRRPALPLLGLTKAIIPRSRSPFHLTGKSVTKIRLVEAGEHCTPIWATPTKNGGMNFMRIVPVLNAHNNRRKESTCATGSMFELIRKKHVSYDRKRCRSTRND